MTQEPILIVDDDADILDALHCVLDSAGHSVLTAGSGMQALSLLRQGKRPRLVLLDLMMPQMNGQEFLAEMRREPACDEIPVYVMTAAKAPPTVKLANGVIRKPLDFDFLLDLAR